MTSFFRIRCLTVLHCIVAFQVSVALADTLAQDKTVGTFDKSPKAAAAPDVSTSWRSARDRLAMALQSSDQDGRREKEIAAFKAAANKKEFDVALQPLILLKVSINPESRVKIQSLLAKITLSQNRPRRFLIAVDNTAGITAPLNLSGIDLATHPPGTCDWCNVEVIDSPFTSRFFSGTKTEYKIMQITSNELGLREIRIIGDAGQGTQDLGFRATTDLLMDIRADKR